MAESRLLILDPLHSAHKTTPLVGFDPILTERALVAKLLPRVGHVDAIAAWAWTTPIRCASWLPTEVD